MTTTGWQPQTLPLHDAVSKPAAVIAPDQTQTQTDLATYLPQVAAEAVAKAEDADIDKVNDLFNDRVRYVASRTLDELRKYAGKHDTITGFDYSATALKFAWIYKRTEGRRTIKLPNPSDAELTDILNIIHTARQGTDLTLRAMTNCLEYFDLHPAIPDAMTDEIMQAWHPVKSALAHITHKADLFEMAMTRYVTDIDNLIDLIQKGNDND